jgi:hypothetical protein
MHVSSNYEACTLVNEAHKYYGRTLMKTHINVCINGINNGILSLQKRRKHGSNE